MIALSFEAAFGWLAFLLAAFGLAYIVGHSKISLVFRVLIGGMKSGVEGTPDIKPLVPVLGPWLIDLVECPACFGFWIGLVTGFVYGGWRAAVFLALITCGSNFILASRTGLLHGGESR